MQSRDIPVEKFMESVNDFWNHYAFMKITDKHGGDSSKSDDKTVHERE